MDFWYNSCIRPVDADCAGNDMNAYVNSNRFLNMTQVNALYGDKYNVAPRAHMKNDENDSVTKHIYWLDLSREKAI